MTPPETVRIRLLTAIAAGLGVAALHWSYPVSMPLTAAIFIIAATWPLKLWLEQVLPPSLSYAGTVLGLFLVLAAFAGAVYFALEQVAEAFVQNQEQFRDIHAGYVAWGRNVGVPVLGGEAGYDRLIVLAEPAFWQLYAVLGYLGVIGVLVIMGLPEVRTFGRKFRRELETTEHRELVEAVEQIATRVRQYIGTVVLTSVITGVISAAWSFAVGLDLALTWGVLNFLLNFIPVFGNMVGILPPTLYAMFQFGGWVMPLVVFAGFAVLQFTISNVLYPLLQGRGMSMPPVAIVVALLFWGWVWGVVGALLAVPLTAALIIVCEHFQSTRWFARMLTRP